MHPDSCRYTKEHEWICPEGDVYAVGITAYAAEQLGDVTYVEVPQPGKKVKQGDAVASVESVKAASDVYAPAGGMVYEVNEALEGTPELVNQDPFGEGWFFKLENVKTSEFNALMDVKAYEAYLATLEH
jgi:glycine cleavage system H protein